MDGSEKVKIALKIFIVLSFLSTMLLGDVTINDITKDNVINLVESQGSVDISGTATGGDIATGDDVIITINGNEITTSVASDGNWTASVLGSDLRDDDDTTVDVTVYSTDSNGNQTTTSASKGYSVDTVFDSGVITINDITSDNIINAKELGNDINVSGTATGGDISPNDTVTINVAYYSFTTTVSDDGNWSVNIGGNLLRYNGTDGEKTLSVSVASSDDVGNEGTSTNDKNYSVDTVFDATINNDPITNDNIINYNESNNTITITGTVSGTDAKTDDTIIFNINNKDYNTTLNSDGTWSVDVNGSDLATYEGSHSFLVYIDAVDNAGNRDNGSYISYNVDTIAKVDVLKVTSMLDSSDTFLADGIRVDFSTESYDENISFSIDGVNYEAGSSRFLFIKNSDLNLVDGQEYNVTLNQMTDIAGNDVNRTNLTFIYDRVGDEANYAKELSLGTTSSQNIHTTDSDEDWFKIYIPQKGSLDINSTNAKVQLYQIDADNGIFTIIGDANDTSLHQDIIKRGTYYIKAYGDAGDYDISTTFTPLSKLEFDKRSRGHISLLNNMTKYASYFFVDGGVLYTDYAPFVVYDGNRFRISGNTLEITNYLLNDTTKTISLESYATTLSLSGNLLYILLDNQKIAVYDISNVDNIQLLQTFSMNLALTNIAVYNVGNDTYIYGVYNQNLVIYKVINNTLVLQNVYDEVFVQSLWAESGLLYGVGSGGIYMFDISATPARPRFLIKNEDVYTNICGDDGIIYVNNNGNSITQYEARYDYPDSFLSSDFYDRVAPNTTISLNKFAGKKDSDVFAIDLEYKGELNISVSDVSLLNLTLSIYTDDTLTNPITSSFDLLSDTFSMDLNATTYYIQISSSDINGSDDYNLTTLFIKEDNTKDNLLNASFTLADDITTNSGTLSNAGIYQLSFNSYTNVTLDANATLYGATTNNTTPYTNFIVMPSYVKAGTYYIQTKDTNQNYSFVKPNSDEYKKGLRVVFERLIKDATPNTMRLSKSNAFINFNDDILNKIAFINNADENTDLQNILLNSVFKKLYIAQTMGEDKIYALYSHKDSITNTNEIGVDVVKFIDIGNKFIQKSIVIDQNASTSFLYKMGYANNKLIITTPTSLVSIDTNNYTMTTNASLANGSDLVVGDSVVYVVLSDGIYSVPLNDITATPTQIISGSSYKKIVVSSNAIYALTPTQIDVIQNQSVIQSKLLDGELTGLALSDNILYVSTKTNGIIALDVTQTPIQTIKKVSYVLDIVDVKNVGDELYFITQNTTQDNLYRLQIMRDFPNINQEAITLPFDVNYTGDISDNNDTDWLKIQVPTKGYLNINMSGSDVKLYNYDLVIDETNSSINRLITKGTYYLEISNSSKQSYGIEASFAPLFSNDAVEKDSVATPRISNQVNTNISGSNIVVDDGKIYTNTTPYTIKDGYKFLINANSVEVRNIFNDNVENILQNLPANGLSLDIVGDTLYLLADDNYVYSYDISDIYHIYQLNRYSVAPQTQMLKVYEIGNTIYFYTNLIKDNRNDLATYQIDGINISLISYFDNIDTKSFAINDGVLYIVGGGGIFLFDITTPQKPRLIAKDSTNTTFDEVASYDGKIYLRDNGGAIYQYNASYDSVDNVQNVDNYDRLDINQTILMNKFGGKADVDIYAIDLEYSGNIIIKAEGVDIDDLSLSLYDDSNLSYQIGQTINLKTEQFQADVKAKTYYLKISSNDVNQSDNYTLTINTSATKKMSLLNRSLTQSDDISQNEGVLNEIGLYKFSINVPTILDLDAGAKVYTATYNPQSKYATLQELSSLSLDAGVYYIKVENTPTNYKLYINDTDEFKTALHIISEDILFDGGVPKTALKNGFLNVNQFENEQFLLHNSPLGDVLLTFDVENAQIKNYIYQAQDGRYIYALYTHTNPLNQNVELGVDKIDYIDENNSKVIDTLMIDLNVNSGYDGYQMVYANGHLFIVREAGLTSIDTTTQEIKTNTNLVNIQRIYLYNDALYLLTNQKVIQVDTNDINTTQDVFTYTNNTLYRDMIVDTTNLYLLSTSAVDIINNGNIIKSYTLDANLSSMALSDNILYLGSQNEWIEALDVAKTPIIKTKDIATTKDVLALKNRGNTLYIFSDENNNSMIYQTKLSRDFSGDFANAFHIEIDQNITGQIASSTDKDMFKITLDSSGTLTTTTQTKCQLYEDQNLSKVYDNCSNTLHAGTYFLELSDENATSYTLHLAFEPLSNDAQDTLRFFEPSNQNATYSGKIDVVGDVDYFGVKVTQTGVLEIDATNVDATLRYGNGVLVPQDENGNYIIKNSGLYYLRVSGDEGVTYNITTTLHPLDMVNYIDDANTQNRALGEIELGGANSLIVALANYVYRVDEVNNLLIIDVSNPKEPKIISRLNLGNTIPTKLFLDGTILYVALGDSGYAIVDVSDVDAPYLYGIFPQTTRVNSIVAYGKRVYVGCDDALREYDVTQPQNPVLIESSSYTNIKDLVLDYPKLYIASDDGISLRDVQTQQTQPITSNIANVVKMTKDNNYLFIANDTQIGIVDLNNSNALVSYNLKATSTRVNDLYHNENILYVARDNSYETIEYKDINNLFGKEFNGGANSIAVANNALILSLEKLEIKEVGPDYVDTITNPDINHLSLDTPTTIRGEFSRDGDVDSFLFTNVDYTGKFSFNVQAKEDVNISLIKADGTIVTSQINTLDTIINAGDFFIQIQSVDPSLEFSYSFYYTFENDGELDVLDNTLTYQSIDKGIQATLYAGGGDKDYYTITLPQRGTLVFEDTDIANAKITLLYQSGTPIATNFKDGNLTKNFQADLSAGTYYILVQNSNPSQKEEVPYKLKTSFTPTKDAMIENGASNVKLQNIDMLRYNSRSIFVLEGDMLTRYTNLLERKNSISIDELNTTSQKQLTLYTYKKDTKIINYIGYIDMVEPNKNSVFKVTYDLFNDTLQRENFVVDNSGLSDEEIVYIDKDEYIYYYDEDSIYIAPLSNTETPQQITESALSQVFVQDGVLYVVSKNYIKLFDVSNKDNINDTTLLDTIDVANAESIFVNKTNDLLFVGANDKIAIYNISDKNNVTLLSTTDVSFEDGDMYYTGTPTSLYLQEDELVVGVKDVGLLIYKMDSFFDLTLKSKVLNVGEAIGDVYTLDGSAINYTLTDANGTKELKVYFYDKKLLDATQASTLEVVNSNVSEGCFIATAAYGSYFEPYVKTLRDFRDNVLMTNSIGQEIVKTYYKYSPPIAKVIAHNEYMKMGVRMILTPIVYMIKYPLVVLLLLMMYVIYRKKEQILFHRKMV